MSIGTYISNQSKSRLPSFLAVREEHDGALPEKFCYEKGVEIVARENPDEKAPLVLGELLTLKRVILNQRFAS